MGIISTVEVLLHPKVREALGDDALAEAVFAALRDARMAVFPYHRDEVLQLIGTERAVRCSSLSKGFRVSDPSEPQTELEHGV
jgi:hypothetical protein